MSPLFSPTKCFPPGNLDSIMIPIAALFSVRLKVNLRDINQNGLKHKTYNHCFQGISGKLTLKLNRVLNFLAMPGKKGYYILYVPHL